MNSKGQSKKILKLVGVWLDYKEANIITLKDEAVDISSFPSGIDPGKAKGGHRSKQPFGPMDKVSESKHLEKRIQQEEQFYKSICEKLSDCDEVFIMGPAQAKIGLRKYMSKYKELFPKLQDVITVDSITENQKVEKVKSFYAL